MRIYKGTPALWLLRRQKDNPLFAYKRQVCCPTCHNALLGSSPRNKAGRHIPRYHCSRKHKYWSVNKKDFDETITKFVNGIEFSPEFRQKFREYVLEEWEKRKDKAQDDSINLEKRVLTLKQESRMLTDKIKILTSETAIKAMETELDKVDQQIALVIEQRNKKEHEVIDVQVLINYSNYFMEHLEDLLLGGPNPLVNAALFGLAFDEPPTYFELVSGTPQLSCLFKLNEQFKKIEGASVAGEGVEPSRSCLHTFLRRNCLPVPAPSLILAFWP